MTRNFSSHQWSTPDGSNGDAVINLYRIPGEDWNIETWGDGGPVTLDDLAGLVDFLRARIAERQAD